MASRRCGGNKRIAYLCCYLAVVAALLLVHVQNVNASGNGGENGNNENGGKNGNNGNSWNNGNNGNDGNNGGNNYSGEDPDTTKYEMDNDDENGCEVAKCQAENACKNKKLNCPKQCPKRNNGNHLNHHCFVDCSTKCETTCKHRKPNCNGYSSVCYDPRFVGGDGVMFYFHGKANEDFCLVSDANLHINAHFIGIRPEGRSRDFTWVQTLGILFQGHKISIGAKSSVASWDDSVDRLEITYDGQNVRVPTVPGSTWTDNSVQIERLSDTNTAQLRIRDLLKLTLQVVPITKDEDRVHGYGLPANDVFAHLNVQFNFIRYSENVDGVLGQTYRSGYVNPVKLGVPMPIMGGEPRFRVSSLFGTDCPANQFHQDNINANGESVTDIASTDCASTFGAGGLLCRRR